MDGDNLDASGRSGNTSRGRHPHDMLKDALTERAPVVFVKDGGVFASSRDVAEFFDKRHDHVLRDIDKLIEREPSLADGDLPNFGEMVIEVEIGSGAKRQAKAYSMTRDGFTLLAMGFTGPKALKFKLAYIQAFNAMEAEIPRLAGSEPDDELDDNGPDLRSVPRVTLTRDERSMLNKRSHQLAMRVEVKIRNEMYRGMQAVIDDLEERLGLEDANRPKVEIGWGMRLRRARRVAGYKHAEAFAKAIGMEPHTYRCYERAETMPGRESLGLISEKLGTSIDWLLYARGKGPSLKLV